MSKGTDVYETSSDDEADTPPPYTQIDVLNQAGLSTDVKSKCVQHLDDHELDIHRRWSNRYHNRLWSCTTFLTTTPEEVNQGRGALTGNTKVMEYPHEHCYPDCW